jgi:hypothetical protein
VGAGSPPSGTAGGVTAVASPATSAPPVPDVVANIPAAARQRTADGAEAMVAYFIKVSNAASVNPVAGQIPPLSTSSCKSCAGWEEDILTLVRNRRKHKTYPLKVISIGGTVGNPAKDRSYEVVAATREAGPVLNADGSVFDVLDEYAATFFFEMQWKGDSWRVNAIRLGPHSSL